MDEEQTKGVSPPEQSGGVNGLTPIHRRIHCAVTPDTTEVDELGLIAIDHFIDTLAEVATAIARRRKQFEL